MSVTDVQPNWVEDDELIVSFTFLPSGEKFLAEFREAFASNPPQVFAVSDGQFFGLGTHLNRRLGKSIVRGELSPLFEAIRVAYDY